MPHGAPDNFEVQAKPTTYKLSDMAELAVRLGAISSIDRLGDILFYDNFGDGLLKWSIDYFGDIAGVDICQDFSNHGGFSCILKTGTALADYAEIFRNMFNPVLSKTALEAGVQLDNWKHYLQLTIIYYSGTHRYLAHVRYDTELFKLEYYNNEGLWTEIISGVKLYRYSSCFHTFKMVIDLVNKKYVRLRVDNLTYSLEGLSLRSIDDTEYPHIYIQIYMENKEAVTQDNRVDSIIITQNEP